MDVSIIIVNYNTKQLLENCLRSIYNYSRDFEFEIIVSDNASQDGSIEMIKQNFPEVIVIQNDNNLGFGKANNVAARIAKGKYLFFLNSDTVFLNNSLKYFLDYAENERKNCILGAWLTDLSGLPMPSYGKFTHFRKQLLIYLYDFFPLLLKLRLLLLPRKRELSYPISKKVDFVTGADLFLSNQIFNELQGFDETFFMYHEDDDLCRRALIRGCESFIIRGPQIVHLEGKSSKNSSKKIMIREQSFFSYLKKYEKKNSLFLYKRLYKIFIMVRFFSSTLTLKEKMEINNNTRIILQQ